MILSNVEDVREQFGELYNTKSGIVTDKTGVKTIEIIGAQFTADEDTIFGKVNEEYIRREFEWYDTHSFSVKDMKGGKPPDVWLKTAGPEGHVNSNYGGLVYSGANEYQFHHTLEELKKNPDSRRAVMIYNRPMIWYDYVKYGMNDFICTMYCHYFIRKNTLETIVYMRSNDVVFGYKNDYAWQERVTEHLYNELCLTYPTLKKGGILWNAGSIHIYERHFYLIDYYLSTGVIDVSKSEYHLWNKEQK